MPVFIAVCVLIAVEDPPGLRLLFAPEGPLGAMRAGMIAGDSALMLQREAVALDAQLDEAARVRALQGASLALLRDNMDALRDARSRLRAAILNRVVAPPPWLDTPQVAADLASAIDTLAAFDQSLGAGVFSGALPAVAPVFEIGAARGAVPLPLGAAAEVRRRFNAADAAGVRHPGWVLAAPAGALVRAPWLASVRYAGPLAGYENLIVLEPGEGFLLLLAGLEQVYVAEDDVLLQGAPLGRLRGADTAMNGDYVGEFSPKESDFFTPSDEEGGIQSLETLYIELRQGGDPVDPAIWFAFDG